MKSWPAHTVYHNHKRISPIDILKLSPDGEMPITLEIRWHLLGGGDANELDNIRNELGPEWQTFQAAGGSSPDVEMEASETNNARTANNNKRGLQNQPDVGPTARARVGTPY